MSLRRVILSRVARALPMGAQATLKRTLMIPDQLAALQNMRRCGFMPSTIIDVGAYIGKFAAMCERTWPEASLVMFEPQPDKQDKLRAMTEANPRLTLRQELLGKREGLEVDFHLHASGSTMKTFRSDQGTPTIKLLTTTMDKALAATPFERPDLVKIDVQGAEMDVIEGGMAVFAAAQAVILELTTVPEYEGSPLFHEMVSFMGSHGFRVYDICTIWRNSLTHSMIEADVIFAKPSCRVWDEKNYWSSKAHG